MTDNNGSQARARGSDGRPKPRHRGLRIGCFLALVLILALLGVALWLLRTPLYKRFVLYPRYDRALAELKTRLAAPPDDGWTDFRSVVHSHSYLSHDSIGTPAEIVAAAKKVGIEAIFMTDHPTPDNRQLSHALSGDASGVIFFPGYESGENMAVFPGPVTGELNRLVQLLPLEKKFDNVAKRGGLVIYPHPEEGKRRWDIVNFHGMEIYNIHTDFKEVIAAKRVGEFLLEELVLGRRFPMLAFRAMQREPVEFLARWDDLNAKRHVIGTAGNDAHQNVRLALQRTEEGKLAVYFGVEEEPEAELGGVVGWLAGWVAEGTEEIWARQVDPYERSFAFVNTFLLAREHSPQSLFEALAQGHNYVAFAGFLDPRGFRFSYRNGNVTAIMGDELAFQPGGSLHIRVPLETEIRLIRDGTLHSKYSDQEVTAPVTEPGLYRVEARISVGGESWPWIYSSPIHLLSSDSPPG